MKNPPLLLLHEFRNVILRVVASNTYSTKTLSINFHNPHVHVIYVLSPSQHFITPSIKSKKPRFAKCSIFFSSNDHTRKNPVFRDELLRCTIMSVDDLFLYAWMRSTYKQAT